MSKSLPLRANLEWLKKQCKDRLVVLRAGDPDAKLSDAQLLVAREYGFASWRKLKDHVDQVRAKLDQLVPAPADPTAAAAVAADDPDLAAVLSAVKAGDTNVAAQLLGRRPELAAARGPDGQTPLHVAAEYNDARLGVLLLAYGADPEATYGQSGHTALSWAATCGSFDFARALTRLGVRPDLFCAAGTGALEEVRTLFDDTGTLLPGASRTGSTRLAPDGTRLPCPPPTPREQVSDALYIACRNANAEVVRFLMTCEPDLSFRAYMGGTALHWAYFGGSAEVIDMLLHAGADPTARDEVLHCTPRAFGICVPASWGMPDVVRRRVAEDPTLAVLMDGQTSALHEAARNGHVEIVKTLLEAGAPPDLRDGAGRTAADLATERGHAAVLELFR